MTTNGQSWRYAPTVAGLALLALGAAAARRMGAGAR